MTSFLSGLKFRKRRRACDICRISHVKCDGKNPCAYCNIRNLPCCYSTETPKTITPNLRQQVLQLKNEIQTVKFQEFCLKQKYKHFKERQARKKRKIEEKAVIVNDSRLYIGYILYQFSRHLQSKAPFIPESVSCQSIFNSLSWLKNFQTLQQIYTILNTYIRRNC